jgi:hypothetical protein
MGDRIRSSAMGNMVGLVGEMRPVFFAGEGARRVEDVIRIRETESDNWGREKKAMP